MQTVTTSHLECEHTQHSHSDGFPFPSCLSVAAWPPGRTCEAAQPHLAWAVTRSLSALGKKVNFIGSSKQAFRPEDMPP